MIKLPMATGTESITIQQKNANGILHYISQNTAKT